MSCGCKWYVALPHSAMVCLQCVTVVFSDYVHDCREKMFEHVDDLAVGARGFGTLLAHL